MEELEVRAKNPYRIYIGREGLKSAVEIFQEYFGNRKETGEIFYIITDKNVAKYHLKGLMKELKRNGFRVKNRIMPYGEKIKSIRYYHSLLRDMVKAGLTRDSVVVALGGGVIGDLAGFAASTYMRGVDFVQIPTTLLSQADSSIGGKVGINLKEGKNLVGSFYTPAFVLIDTTLLNTLPPRQITAGMAEVVKAALIFNEKMFSKIYDKISELRGDSERIDNASLKDGILKDPDFTDYIVLSAVKVKREVVQSDEFESGLRMILNFGHTFGHAIEKLTGYKKFLHGEAVIVGMKIATELSHLMEYLKEKEYKKVMTLLNSFEIPKFKLSSVKGIMKYIESDKKKRGGKVNYILLKKIGYGYPDDSVERQLVVKAIKSILTI